MKYSEIKLSDVCDNMVSGGIDETVLGKYW